MIEKDEVRALVGNVFSFLESNPYTRSRSKYLVYPVLYAFLCGSYNIFDSLGFRDRIALRTASTLAIRPCSDSTRNFVGKRSINDFE